MTGQQSRPGGRSQAASEVLAVDTFMVAADAHNFGRGMPVSERRALARRGMAALKDALPDLVEQLARRCVQQAIEESLPTYWISRAERLEQIGTVWADEAAVACRRHGWLLATAGLPDDLEAELAEGLELVGGEGR